MRARPSLRPAFLLLACVAVAAAAGGGAPPGTMELPGAGLSLEAGMAGDTAIRVDPSLQGRARVRFIGNAACFSASAGSEAGSGDRSIRIRTQPCAGEDASLEIAIPAAFPLALSVTGSGDVQLTGSTGAASVELSGSGGFQAGGTGALSLRVRGSGDATIGTVAGPASVSLLGGGSAQLGVVEGPVAVQRRGSGELSVGSGGGVDAE
jgi:hypothetical protein